MDRKKPLLPVLPGKAHDSVRRTTFSCDGTPMQYFVETGNIVHFKALLRTETRPKERAVLAELLAEEEAKLAAKVASEAGPMQASVTNGTTGLRPTVR